jgi:PAS domain S-box-containing protein
MLGHESAEHGLDRDVTTEYVRPEDRRRWQARMEHDGVVQGFEAELRRKDGTTLWVSNTGRAVRGPDGRTVAYEGILEDITQRKRAEDALRAEQAVERGFRARLTALHGVLNSLSECRSEDDLCRRAIEMGRSALGFGRLGLWFVDEGPDTARGAFGLDEQGRLRDERRQRLRVNPSSPMGRILSGERPHTLEEKTALRDHQGNAVGEGAQALVGLWDGHRVVGCITTDTLLRPGPITPQDVELLTLYASALGHLWTRLLAEAELRRHRDRLEETVAARTAEIAAANQRLQEEVRERERTEQALRRSQEDLRLLVGNAHDIIFRWEFERGYTFLTPAIQRVFGRTMEEYFLDGQLGFRHTHPDDLPRAHEMLDALRKGQEPPSPLELRQFDSQGELRHMEYSLSAARDEGGRIVGVEGVGRDVTRRRLAEQRLRHRLGFESALSRISRGFINAPPDRLGQAIDEAVALLGEVSAADRCYVFEYSKTGEDGARTHSWNAPGVEPARMGNRFTVRPYRWSVGRMLAARPVQVASVNDLPQEAEAERLVMQSQGVKSSLWIPIVCSGQVRGVLGLNAVRSERRWEDEDVTLMQTAADVIANALERQNKGRALREAHEALERRVEERTADLASANQRLLSEMAERNRAERALVQTGKMAAIGGLAAGIAHELNNPLATVASSAELLRGMASGGPAGPPEAIGDTVRSHLKKIEDNVFRCKGIIENLLGFARGEQGREESARTDAYSLLRIARHLAVSGAGQRKRAVVLAAAPPALDADGLPVGPLPRREGHGTPPTMPLTTRPRQVQQVLLNLVLNAMDAIGPDGCVVLAASRPEEGTVEFLVADDGCGIPAETMGRIFDPFFTTKPVGQGTGLGLWISHQIVEALGGTIAVASRPGRGTVARVRVPDGIPGDRGAAAGGDR